MYLEIFSAIILCQASNAFIKTIFISSSEKIQNKFEEIRKIKDVYFRRLFIFVSVSIKKLFVTYLIFVFPKIVSSTFIIFMCILASCQSALIDDSFKIVTNVDSPIAKI